MWVLNGMQEKSEGARRKSAEYRSHCVTSQTEAQKNGRDWKECGTQRGFLFCFKVDRQDKGVKEGKRKT
jgi:hypothetical protein